MHCYLATSDMLSARPAQGEGTYNPFLRCDQPALQKFAGASDPVDVLAAVRRAKDRF